MPLNPLLVFPRARRNKLTITVTLAGGVAVTGTPLHIDDFYVSLRDDKGEYHSWKRTAALKFVKHDPLKAHSASITSTIPTTIRRAGAAPTQAGDQNSIRIPPQAPRGAPGA